MNPWLYVFSLSLILFCFLVDRHTLIHNLWAGFVCVVYQLGLNIVAHRINYFHYMRVDEGFPKIIVFANSINIFFLGIAFMMGILFVQFLPRNYFLQLIHASVWLIFFRLMYQISEQNNMIEFIYYDVWRPGQVIPANMLALAWLKNILKGGRNQHEDFGRNSVE
jgi:hypothetical protein